MAKFLIPFLCCLFLGEELFAQDPHFSQFYQAPLYINPGFTGITPQQRVVFNHRTQWPSLPQAFSTFAASYDIWVNDLRSGFGLLATTDQLGSAGWRTTTVGVLYSYKIQLSKQVVLSPGVYFGYGLNGVDRSKIRLGDALQFNGQTLDPTLRSVGNRQYFDFHAGLLAYTKQIWFGVSLNHVNRPNISVLNITSRLPLKTNIHAGMRIPLSTVGLGRKSRLSYLTPSFVFRIQGPITQLDLGVNYHIDPVSVGVWYRGKPYEVNDDGIVNQDAMIFQVGAYMKNFTVGYSYDFSISRLLTSSGGAHEVSLSYEFQVKGFLKQSRRNDLIPCPTVTGSSSFFSK